MGIELSVLWFLIIGFALMMYVIMDGFDLGIGILFPLVHAHEDRDTMTNTVAPVWDGNETWLVFGGAALFAAFSLAYAVILSALYLPIILMLAGLIWRGVAFEFRFKADPSHKSFWDKAFAGGSFVASFAQGVSLGAFINGFGKVAMTATAKAALKWGAKNLRGHGGNTFSDISVSDPPDSGAVPVPTPAPAPAYISSERTR